MVAEAKVEIHCPSDPSDTGAFQVSWTSESAKHFRVLERAGEGDAQIVYEGSDDATTLTGRRTGHYAYRVKAGTDETLVQSQWCTVRVEPPSMTLAWGLFGTGLLICLSLLIAVFLGHQSSGVRDD